MIYYTVEEIRILRAYLHGKSALNSISTPYAVAEAMLKFSGDGVISSEGLVTDHADFTKFLVDEINRYATVLRCLAKEEPIDTHLYTPEKDNLLRRLIAEEVLKGENLVDAVQIAVNRSGV